MKVDGAVSDDAAAGERDDGAAFAGEKGAHDADGSAHAPDEFVGGFVRNIRAGDADGAGGAFDISTECAEDLDHVIRVRDIGDAADDAVFTGEDGGGKDGEGCVFRSGNVNGSFDGGAAVDDEFIHFFVSDSGMFCEGKTRDTSEVFAEFDFSEAGLFQRELHV